MDLSSTLQFESFVLPPSADYPLYIAAKRYWTPSLEGNELDPSAQTLIVLHSTSFHKETWEPVLEDLFAQVALPGFNQPKAVIREAWCIDCPNHGESGYLNRRILKEPGLANFTCEKYAQAVHRFLSIGPSLNVRVDFRRRNLVGIGHSLGANALLLLHHIQPLFVFSSLVIIEPLISALGSEPLEKLRKNLVNRAKRRRERVGSIEEIRANLRKASRTDWDIRVQDLFCIHALYWSPEDNYYHLCCSAQQEISMYSDKDGGVAPVADLNRICRTIPVHLINGQIPDFIPTYVHQALLDPESGRKFASVVIMDGVGHLIPQKAPRILASHILRALSPSSSGTQMPTSKM